MAFLREVYPLWRAAPHLKDDLVIVEKTEPYLTAFHLFQALRGLGRLCYLVMPSIAWELPYITFTDLFVFL
jgi:hypothetical protein